MATITHNGVSVEWTGTWFSTVKSGSFPVDRDNISARELAELADRGLTHVYGSEAAAKPAALFKAGKINEAEKVAMVAAAKIAYRDAMYADTWGLGTRAPRAGVDRLSQTFWNDAAKRVRELMNDKDSAFVKATRVVEGVSTVVRDMWIDPADGTELDINEAVERYLENDSPDESDATRTKGDVRREVHTANAQRTIAEQDSKAKSRAETRRITGTRI